MLMTAHVGNFMIVTVIRWHLKDVGDKTIRSVLFCDPNLNLTTNVSKVSPTSTISNISHQLSCRLCWLLNYKCHHKIKKTVLKPSSGDSDLVDWKLITIRGCWWSKWPKPSPISYNCHPYILPPIYVTNIEATLRSWLLNNHILYYPYRRNISMK